MTATGSTNAAAGSTVAVTVSNGSTTSNSATVTITAPPVPNTGNLSAGRFLEQAAFGPTAAELAHVKQVGFSAWLDEQFALPETAITVPADMGAARAQYLYRLASSPDQLRQRMMFALNSFILVSGVKNIYPDENVPFQQILSKDGFGNFRTLLKDVSLSPQMGKFLDLANSNKPGVMGNSSSNANENYARELMQLFSIGLVMLNPDGSPQLVNGLTVPTYTQADIHQHALALTGWTYPTAPGATPQPNNWEYFVGQMESRPANHDTTQKNLINGVVLPAGQTPMQDLDGVIDCVFNHPNTPPFVATRLIRNLVTSNPSPAFIQRIAAVFANNGSGVRGDLAAVLRAILFDPEARLDTATPNSGRLKDTIQFVISFARGLNGQISPANQFAWVFDNMGQTPMTAPSVFGFYSPVYRVPKTTLFGPEFQVYTPADSVLRANFVEQILTQNLSDIKVDQSPFVAVAGNIQQLLDAVDQAFFYGRMDPQIRASLTKALVAAYDNTQRVNVAVYLASLAGQYAVQY